MSADPNDGSVPAWATFPSGLAISREAQKQIADLVTDLGNLDAVGERLPDVHGVRTLEVLATIRETAEAYTRIIAEYLALHEQTAGTVSERRLATLARASNKTIARWKDQPVNVDELDTVRNLRPVPRT